MKLDMHQGSFYWSQSSYPDCTSMEFDHLDERSPEKVCWYTDCHFKILSGSHLQSRWLWRWLICSGRWNISHYKQSFSELLSHKWSNAIKVCNSWVNQTISYLISKLMLLFYIGPCFVAFQVETLVRDMDNIYIKSIQAVQKVMINDKHCFELYPFT